MSTTIESAEPRSAKSSRVLENPPNARRTMEALRELGYDSYSSILDILDNCIDAHAATIAVEVAEQRGDIIITIEDDGSGMDEETLSEALRLGSDTEREVGDLGKFGAAHRAGLADGLERKPVGFAAHQGRVFFAEPRQPDGVVGQRIADHGADHVALLHRVERFEVTPAVGVI